MHNFRFNILPHAYPGGWSLTNRSKTLGNRWWSLVLSSPNSPNPFFDGSMNSICTAQNDFGAHQWVPMGGFDKARDNLVKECSRLEPAELSKSQFIPWNWICEAPRLKVIRRSSKTNQFSGHDTLFRWSYKRPATIIFRTASAMWRKARYLANSFGWIENFVRIATVFL